MIFGNYSAITKIMPSAVMPKVAEKVPKVVATKMAVRKPRVAVVVYDGLCTFEYGIATEAFGLYRPEVGGHLYDVSSVAIEAGPLRAAGGIDFTVRSKLAALNKADTIIVPGWRGKDEPVPQPLINALRKASNRGARLVSICSGIYVLAAAGLLANRPATTHWRYADDLASKYKDIDIQLNKLYVDDGDIVTSAGSSAGIDACLHIIRRDYGADIANSVARRLVMHAHRQGGQAQFIEQPLPDERGSHHRLSALMDELRGRLGENHQIASMAKIAGMSQRTFQRRFLAVTGTPVMQWLVQQRLSRACRLLEITDLSIDRVSEEVGFRTAEAMRYHFRRALMVSPLDYRKRFRCQADKAGRAGF